MPSHAKPIPDGYHSVTPYLTVHDAAKAIDFYKKAFDATEVHRMQTPQGKIMHAELKIGDSFVMLADEMPNMEIRSPQSLGGTSSGMFLYVKDVDAAYKQATDAGAQAKQSPTDMFWGDRYGKVVDPFGHCWSLATHVEDVAPAEMERRAHEQMVKMAQQKTRTA